MITWIKQELRHHKDFESAIALFKTSTIKAAAFDTEDTGLHLIDDKPFVFQFGWVTTDLIGYAYAIDLELCMWGHAAIREWHALVRNAPYYLGHNVKFDLHMCENIDCGYTGDNISDTQIWIRMAHDNIPIRKGGVTLKLKEYVSRYITITAKDHEKAITYQRRQIAKELNVKLKQRMGWAMYQLDEFFKDMLNDPEDLPTIKDYCNYNDWLTQDVPAIMRNKVRGKVTTDDVPYTMVNRKLLIEYALLDIVYTLEVFLLTEPVVRARCNMLGVELEQRMIYPYFEMERTGFDIDQDYVNVSKARTKAYIRAQREKLIQIAGCDITSNQNEAIKKLLCENGINVDSTGVDVLEIAKNNNKDHPMVALIEQVLKLRTLEKWYSTYLVRFVGHKRVYTQINQVGAASGRVSSDFQQFPKAALIDDAGNELFNPRRAVLTLQQEGYDATVYYDYSQVELRASALYTVILGAPDLNLCRAYMPYKCVRKDGTLFDPNNREHINDWAGEWYLEEDPTKHWEPVDVHGATTKAAFNIDESHPDFHMLRYLGKRVNFAKNYGAQQGKIHEMFPDKPPEVIKAIDEGYYKAFPGLKKYQNYCYEIGRYQPYATNLYGIRYYGVSGHNLVNMLIQGSTAYLLKEKIYLAWVYLKHVNAKSKLQMNIHDELSICRYKGEQAYLDEVQRIMQDMPDWMVPIVADAEITHTNWADKVEL